jgi:hypothetical protein
LIDRRFRRTHIGRGAIGVQFFGASLGTIRRARVTGGRRPGLFVTILAGRTCLGSPLQPRWRLRSPPTFSQPARQRADQSSRCPDRAREAVDFLPENACLAAQNVSGLPGIGQSRSGRRAAFSAVPVTLLAGSPICPPAVATVSATPRASLWKRSARPSSE